MDKEPIAEFCPLHAYTLTQLSNKQQINESEKKTNAFCNNENALKWSEFRVWGFKFVKCNFCHNLN